MDGQGRNIPRACVGNKLFHNSFLYKFFNLFFVKYKTFIGCHSVFHAFNGSFILNLFIYDIYGDIPMSPHKYRINNG